MATKTQSLTVPARDKAEQDCHCGCTSCDGTCCSLDCIVKPRFFCGQLLTDADLSALLKWARDRFALSRYRHGWGVVCGLDVRCDSQTATSVIVTPGYAVNCCGDDVIVCAEATLDLKDACREHEDPCADLRREVQGKRLADAVRLSGATLEITVPKPGQITSSGGPITPNPVQIDNLNGARAVDIYLSYTEQPSDPSTALGRSSCKQTPECEYSRARESYKLSWETGVEGTDPVRARAQAWHEGYGKCLDVLTSFRKRFPQTLPGIEVRGWLLRWIDEHPQYQVCGLRETICAQPDNYFGSEQNLVTVLFQLVQSCRNAYLQCNCFSCDEDTRVPLARVWVKPDNGTTDCRIVAIDQYPPYRRPIQPECWPAPLGSVNVGRFIWHRREEVCTAVRDLGLSVDFANFGLPTKLVDLQERLSCNLFVECGQHRTALLFDAGPLGNRVVGFCDGTPPPPPPPPPCPQITLIHKDTISVDDPLEFSVTLNPAVAGVTYRWSIDRGTITSGQGTARITVDTTGLAGQSVTATVDLGGLDPNCPHTKSGTTRIVDQGPVPCSEITMDFRDKVSVNEQLVFSVTLNPAVAGVTYRWSLDRGTITSGQGTARITVDATGLGGQSVTATVDISGLAPNCPHTKSGTTKIAPPPPPPPPPCPEIIMRNQAEAPAAQKELEFEVTLEPLPQIPLTYNWSVHGGTIQSGQGTPAVVVNIVGLEGPSSTATVDIGGLAPNCPHTKSGTTRVAPPPPPLCPQLIIRGPDTANPNQQVGYFLEIIGGIPIGAVTESWTVSNGTITSGQGTTRITVDTTGAQGAITVAVEVSGYDPSCNNFASHTTVIGNPQAIKFLEFGDWGPDADLGVRIERKDKLLDDFAVRLQQEPSMRGFITADWGFRRDEAPASVRQAQDYLVNTRGIDAARIIGQVANPWNPGGEVPVVQLWLLPPGAPLPTTAIVNTKNRLDTLTELKGIAAARVKVLSDAGIRTFAHLAAVDPNRLKELIPTSTEDDRTFWIAEAKKRV